MFDWADALGGAWESAVAESANQGAQLAAIVPSNAWNGFDISATLKSVVDPVVSVAKTIGEFQLQRDAFAEARADRDLNRFAKQTQLDLARDQLSIGASLEKLKAQTALALAQRNAGALISGGGLGTILILIAVAAAVFFLVKK